ncbi:cytochrome c [Sphingobium sp. CECT 9361]|uniref:c-type cytochrome n=1 Tax=Sphingobium sp. CECT 9361 TaxID=2845384 RepID=UPI001E5B383F|nr:cytochrome c [Sphingobium sp. CECT 9361]CAH0357237.1 hypothetical protein SPH9361_04886 [Sphingobium sp. CECT 9361]
MRFPLFIAVSCGILVLASGLRASPAYEVDHAGVKADRLARQSWMLQCQGCHRPGATGTPPGTPPLAGQVSSFLKVKGGREYLGMVPGVATAALTDSELANLLNWTLRTFDAGNIPDNFVPYTANEMGRLRRKPLRTEAKAVRQALVASLDRVE